MIAMIAMARSITIFLALLGSLITYAAAFSVDDSSWDANLPDAKFRVVHAGNQLSIDDSNLSDVKMVYSAGSGRIASNEAVSLIEVGSWKGDEVQFDSEIIARVYQLGDIPIGDAGELHSITIVTVGTRIFGVMRRQDTAAVVGSWR